MLYIGVSSCLFHPDPSRATFGPKTLCYLENDMARYLAREDVIPVLIPDLGSVGIKRLAKQLYGLVLQGGVDLAPQTYGETPILEGRWKGDSIRDEYELAVMRAFLEEGKPVFGICRGFQLMNAYFGGTLYQDIATQRPASVRHRDADEYDRVHHGITWVDGSYMQQLYKDDTIAKVNSVHHQGVKDLGKGLLAQGHCSEDGIIEAFIHSGHEPGKVMGVQWHPEYSHTLGDRIISPEPLITAFLSFAKKQRTF
jgi:putative glutamine amidotransferase